MQVSELQDAIAQVYYNENYATDLYVLLAGIFEEGGELAKAVNMRNPLYVAKPGTYADGIEHELCDLVMYLFAFASTCGIDIGRAMQRRLEAKDAG